MPFLKAQLLAYLWAFTFCFTTVYCFIIAEPSYQYVNHGVTKTSDSKLANKFGLPRTPTLKTTFTVLEESLTSDLSGAQQTQSAIDSVFQIFQYILTSGCKNGNYCPYNNLCFIKTQKSSINNEMFKNISPCKILPLIKQEEISPLEVGWLRVFTRNTAIKRKRRQTNQQFIRSVPSEEMPQVIKMANFAMYTLDLIDEDNQKRVVINVDDAKKQLNLDGSGIMYFLTVSTQDSQCPEDTEAPSGPGNCLSKGVGPTRTCKLELLRSWVPNSSPVNALVVKSECSLNEETGS